MDFNNIPGVGKIQERLLSKSAQNRVLNLRLGRVNAIGKCIAQDIQFCVPEGKPNPIGSLIDFVEDNQIVMLGRSRSDFIEALEAHVERDDGKFGNNK